MLTHIVFHCENGWDTFNMKLPWNFLLVVRPAWEEPCLMRPLLEKGWSCRIYYILTRIDIDKEHYAHATISITDLLTPNILSSVGCGVLFYLHCSHVHSLAQSAGAVEYTEPSVLIMTLNYLMERLQSWNFGECGVPFYCNCFLIHSGPEW